MVWRNNQIILEEHELPPTPTGSAQQTPPPAERDPLVLEQPAPTPAENSAKRGVGRPRKPPLQIDTPSEESAQ